MAEEGAAVDVDIMMSVLVSMLLMVMAMMAMV